MDLDFDKKEIVRGLKLKKKILLFSCLSFFDGGICRFQRLVCKRVS